MNLYLDGPILGNQLVLNSVTPQSSFCEVLQQVRVHNLWERPKRHLATFPSMDTGLWRHKAANAFSSDLKLSREHPAGVDVAGVSLNGLVVAQYLCGGSCGHGGQEQTVPHTMPEHTTEEAGMSYNLHIQ